MKTDSTFGLPQEDGQLIREKIQLFNISSEKDPICTMIDLLIIQQNYLFYVSRIKHIYTFISIIVRNFCYANFNNKKYNSLNMANVQNSCFVVNVKK